MVELHAAYAHFLKKIKNWVRQNGTGRLKLLIMESSNKSHQKLKTQFERV